MKRNIVGSTALMVALALWGCNNKNQPASLTDNRKPVISIADLMIDKITNSPDSGKSMGVTITKLRYYDNQLFKVLHDSTHTLRQKYFYARRGSCCPCTAGAANCCKCSSGSALAVPTQVELLITQVVDGRESVFMLASFNSPQTRFPKLRVSRDTLDAMEIITVPKDTTPGTYEVSFKGDSIDLTLVIDVDANGRLEISEIR